MTLPLRPTSTPLPNDTTSGSDRFRRSSRVVCLVEAGAVRVLIKTSFLALLLCSACGPQLKATLVRGEQGGDSAQLCNLAWKTVDRPSLTATVVSSCETTGPLRVVVKGEDGSVLAETSIDAQLKANVPATLATPPITPPESSRRITVEFIGQCAHGTPVGSAQCELPRKDPPVTHERPPKDEPAPHTPAIPQTEQNRAW